MERYERMNAMTDTERRAAADALEAAAAALASGGYESAPSNGYPCFDCEDRVAEWLRARAADLRTPVPLA
jgi:hypothetical protein